VLTRLKDLFGNLVIYGLGDVATSLISLLLLPIFTSYLTPEDYGVIGLLLLLEAFTKVALRWGVDTAFMRLYHDAQDQAGRQLLASTLFFFLLVVNGLLLGAALLLLPWLTPLVLGDATASGAPPSVLVALTLVNTFVAGFYFIPLQVLRIQRRSRTFIAISTVRSFGTILARLALVISAGMGVLGIVIADAAVTVVFSLVLARWYVPLIRPVFSRAILREALGFGLPRVPHSVAHQLIGFADRRLLEAFHTAREVGLYSIGASFGLALKLFLSAFEAAWTPFFLGVMREPNAARIYSTVSTYVVALLVVLVSGLAAAAPHVVRLFTTEGFHEAAAVTPWVALGVMFQGLYLVGSIGLVITKETKWYPLATGLAAAVSLGANLVLIPRFGILGAAWANALSYAALAAATVSLSWRVYPIAYEWGRLLRIGAAGALAYAAGTRVVPEALGVVPSLLAAGVVVLGVYGALLAATGFFHPGELRMLQEVRERVMAKRRIPPRVEPDATQVEMAGEIVATAPEPPSESETALGGADDGPLSRDSRSRHR
jgi:O-antigen/teichoic acid export membrane protein